MVNTAITDGTDPHSLLKMVCFKEDNMLRYQGLLRVEYCCLNIKVHNFIEYQSATEYCIKLLQACE